MGPSLNFLVATGNPQMQCYASYQTIGNFYSHLSTYEEDMFEKFANAHNVEAVELYSHGLGTIFGDDMGAFKLKMNGINSLIISKIHLSVVEEAIRKAVGHNMTPLEFWGCTNEHRFHELQYQNFIDFPNKEGSSPIHHLFLHGISFE